MTVLSFHVLQDAFEAKYNFRFEETGGTDITSYSREVCIVYTIRPTAIYYHCAQQQNL
jgi:hypothetical protein